MRKSLDGMSRTRNFFVKPGSQKKADKEDGRRRKKEDIKMIVWNVAVLIGNKGKKWEYIKKFDIIGLVETWCTKEKEADIRKKLQEYDTELSEAREEKVKGRAKGGMLVGIKKGTTDLYKTLKRAEEVIAVEISRKENRYRIILIYMNEKKDHNWKEIKEILEENERRETITVGDFNARIGEEEGWKEEEIFGLKGEKEKESSRRSKAKVINKEGEKMLEEIRNNGLYIANGNIKGDEKGDFTYIGPKGITTIDYLLTNGKRKKAIKEMRIGERIESDHMPLEITWDKEGNDRKGVIENKKKTIIDANGFQKIDAIYTLKCAIKEEGKKGDYM